MKEILVLMMNPAFDVTVTVENFKAGGTNRVQHKTVQAAGKGMNVATVARRFYDAVFVLGLCPAQDKGAFHEALTLAQVDGEFIEAEGSVRSNLKIFDAVAGVTTELNEKGFSASRKAVDTLLKRYEEKLETAAAVVLTGSLPQGVSKDFYRTCAILAKEKGVPVILDAEGEAFSLGIEGIPYAVKPNEFELSQFAKETLDTEETLVAAMQKLLSGGISLVVASAGAKGAYFMNKEKTIFAPSPKVEVKSTVGAGDSMVALMAVCMLKSLSIEELSCLATSAGSVTASCEGTSLCAKEEVMKKSREVTIRYVSKD